MGTITGVRSSTTTDTWPISIVEIDGQNRLRSFYEQIDCQLIEVVQLDHGIDAVIDEEGKITGADRNPLATVLARALGARLITGDYLAGTVVFIGYNDEGDFVSLNETQWALIAETLRKISPEIQPDYPKS